MNTYASNDWEILDIPDYGIYKLPWMTQLLLQNHPT